MHVLNSETAKLAGLKSGEARKRYAVERRQAAMLLKLHEAKQTAETPVEQTADPYINDLACAQVEYLAKLRACTDAKEAAALSQALKNIRETYHMATGAPKPGTIKPERQSSRQQVRQPSEPKLDTTDSGSTGGSTPQ